MWKGEEKKGKLCFFGKGDKLKSCHGADYSKYIIINNHFGFGSSERKILFNIWKGGKRNLNFAFLRGINWKAATELTIIVNYTIINNN